MGAEGHHLSNQHGRGHDHRRRRPVKPTSPGTPSPAPSPTPTPTPAPAPSSGLTPTPPPAAGYAFADEFNGAAGTAPSSGNWSYDLGGGGWGNDELEAYTASSQNAYLDGSGNLAITVTSDGGGGYNSARLVTRGTFVQMYGHFEAAIKLAPGTGLWPAFWLLGVDDSTWPACGELDIMENYGTSMVSSTINNGTVGWTASLEADTDDDGQWHIYRCDWEKGSVSMYKDGKLLQKQTPSTVGGAWPYDSSSAMGGGLYIILNVAVGGTGVNGAKPKKLPATPMLVDWVHAWQ